MGERRFWDELLDHGSIINKDMKQKIQKHILTENDNVTVSYGKDQQETYRVQNVNKNKVDLETLNGEKVEFVVKGLNLTEDTYQDYFQYKGCVGNIEVVLFTDEKILSSFLSRSDIQRGECEQYFLSQFEKSLSGFTSIKNQIIIKTGDKEYKFNPDGLYENETNNKVIAVEVYSKIGKSKSGSKKKIEGDILKLITLQKMGLISQGYIISEKETINNLLEKESWLVFSALNHGLMFKDYSLTPKLSRRLEQAILLQSISQMK